MQVSICKPIGNTHTVGVTDVQTTVVNKQSHGTGISILSIGDPHFKLDNLSDIELYIQRIKELIKGKKPDYVVILGDLLHYHERIHTTVLNRAYDFINSIREICPLYILVGNHDYINNSQFLTTNHWMNAMKEWDNVEIVDKGKVLDTSFGKIIFCPYVFPGKFVEALELIDTNWTSARTIFCHQEFFGCKMGAMESVHGDKWRLNHPFIISGHVHDKQMVQSNIFYTGSSIQHAFGESHDKTITMCYLESEIRLEDFDLKMPTKSIIYMNMDEIDQFEYKKDKNKIRITLSGTSEDFKTFRKSKKYKNLVNDGVKIVYKSEVMKNTSISTKHESFKLILDRLINKENNSYVTSLYTELFSQ
jgi:DNA repair exonuclease SbcCD nuclease subunit